MKGDFVSGPFSPHFENHFLNALAEAARTDPLVPRFALVGSNLLGLHLRHALTERSSGHVNVRFLTFVDLADLLTRQAYLEQKRIPFPSDVEELLLEELASNLSPSSVFHDVASREGFHRALKTTFHDLLDGGVTSLPAVGGKLEELARLFETHRARYLPRFATTADRILDAALSPNRLSDLAGVERLFCYGFYDLTEAQRRLLRKCADELPVSVWFPETVAHSSASRTTRLFLRSLCGNEIPLPADGEPEVRAISAPSEYAEAEETVRWLLGKLAEKPLPLHRVGILLHEPDAYAEPMAEVLERAGLPFYRSGGRPLSSTRLGSALACLADGLLSEWSRGDFIRLLTLFPFRVTLTETMGEPPDWDAWSRKANVTRGLQNFLGRMAVAPTDPPRTRFLDFCRRLVRDLQKIEESAGGWRPFGEALLGFVDRYAEPLSEADAARSLLREFAALSEQGVNATPERVLRVFRKKIADATVPTTGAFERDGLFLGSIVSARLVSFDLVCAPGLAERRFPAVPRPDPLLLDHERRRLNEQAGAGLSLKESRLAEDRMLFELLRRQAKTNALFTYTRLAQNQTHPLLPSSLLAGLEIERAPLLPWHHHRHSAALDAHDWILSDVGRRAVEDPRHLRPLLEAWTPLSSASGAWAHDRFQVREWTAFDGIVDVTALRPHLRPSFSPTGISRYLTCPYRFFLSNVLGLKTLDRPDEVEELRPIDRGDLIHRILHELFASLKEDGLLPFRESDRGAVQERTEKIALRILTEAERDLPLGHELLWRTVRSLILSDLRELLREEFVEGSEFIPHAFEIDFDDFPLSIGDGEIRLRGRIDRVDLSTDGRRARVVDYKTGKPEMKENAFHKGTILQLPVYLTALPQRFPGVDLAESEGILLHTTYGSGFQRIRFGGEALNARRDDFHRLLRTAARGTAAGILFPVPGEGRKNCRGCDFRSICGTGIDGVCERKADDPRTEPIRALKEIE